MSGQNKLEVFISGRPATFATAGERPWKDSLRQLMPPPSLGGMETGLCLVFTLPTLAPAGFPLDIDNLCEPVFSVIVNQIGWFGGRRPNIWWWQATRRVDAETGCRITICETSHIELPPHPPDLHSVYKGELPRSARDQTVADWSVGLAASAPQHKGELSVHLEFGRGGINIGDIATGRVKNFIDCLYPIVGGVCGRPNDHRIATLAVQKGVPELAPNEVSLRTWYVMDA